MPTKLKIHLQTCWWQIDISWYQDGIKLIWAVHQLDINWYQFDVNSKSNDISWYQFITYHHDFKLMSSCYKAYNSLIASWYQVVIRLISIDIKLNQVDISRMSTWYPVVIKMISNLNRELYLDPKFILESLQKLQYGLTSSTFRNYFNNSFCQ